MPEGFRVDDTHLSRIVAMVDSMTRTERQRPDSVGDSRISRIARGSGRSEKEVKDLLKQYHQMRGVMKAVGSAPGLLSRLPGLKQLAQLRQLQGKGMEDVLGGDAGTVEDLMGGGGASPAEIAARMGGLPKGVQPRMAAGAMARARLMGYAPEPVSTETERERERRKKKRKQERKARKDARRRGKKR
jgi:signal recognition particle subunit SRP54